MCMATYGNRRDVGKVGCDTRSVHNIVEGELVDKWADFKQEGEGLNIERLSKMHLGFGRVSCLADTAGGS